MSYDFLSPAFLEAMNDIGRYGHQKYGDQSFQHRRTIGDVSRGNMSRTTPDEIAAHAYAHFRMHLNGVRHDHFDTRRHQLAAVACNAMMEFYFAGLEDEPVKPLCDTTMAPRNPADSCKCIERTDQMGPCDKFEQGDNGRCVYCDHEMRCHPDDVGGL